MSKNQFTGTATQPQCNRKFCQFNNDQYCYIARFILLRLLNGMLDYSIRGLLWEPSDLAMSC